MALKITPHGARVEQRAEMGRRLKPGYEFMAQVAADPYNLPQEALEEFVIGWHVIVTGKSPTVTRVRPGDTFTVEGLPGLVRVIATEWEPGRPTRFEWRWEFQQKEVSWAFTNTSALTLIPA